MLCMESEELHIITPHYRGTGLLALAHLSSKLLQPALCKLQKTIAIVGINIKQVKEEFE